MQKHPETCRIIKAIANKVELNLYNYQLEIILAIFLSATQQEGKRIKVEFSRQSGKSTATSLAVAILLCTGHKFLGRPMQIILTAPQKSQTDTNYDNVKRNLDKLIGEFGVSIEMSNSTMFRLSNGNTVHIQTMMDTSRSESKTADIMIVDEAQHANDDKLTFAMLPMLTATNGTLVLVGTAAKSLCFFYKQLQDPQDSYIYDYERVITDKQKQFDLDGDDFHLNYRKGVDKVIATLGEDHPDFRAPYKLEWLLEQGMLTNLQELSALKIDGIPDGISPQILGLDFAKLQDSTVITVMGKLLGEWFVMGWHELSNTNYTQQVDFIVNYVSQYPSIHTLVCDSTHGSSGDVVVEQLERDLKKNVVGVSFSMKTKDRMAKIMLDNLREGKFKYNGLNAKHRRFEQQMLECEVENKGINDQFLTFHHPDRQDAHDDYVDSLALALLGIEEYGTMNKTEDRLTLSTYQFE